MPSRRISGLRFQHKQYSTVSFRERQVKWMPIRLPSGDLPFLYLVLFMIADARRAGEVALPQRSSYHV